MMWNPLPQSKRMSPEPEADFDSFISDISPDVMKCLENEDFFRKLEARIFPDVSTDRKTCDGSFSVATEILTSAGHDKSAIEDVLDVMRSKGGFCDCEIVLNAAPESSVREAYWKRRALEQK